ncbi:hypothetical protein B0H14DRAFT_3739477 [Mycena olivaceomarginata]|nr:hypothetical protein B0H14DRAFT_3739477 [Mycena olivaceomarginata]
MYSRGPADFSGASAKNVDAEGDDDDEADEEEVAPPPPKRTKSKISKDDGSACDWTVALPKSGQKLARYVLLRLYPAPGICWVCPGQGYGLGPATVAEDFEDSLPPAGREYSGSVRVEMEALALSQKPWIMEYRSSSGMAIPSPPISIRNLPSSTSNAIPTSSDRHSARTETGRACTPRHPRSRASRLRSPQDDEATNLTLPPPTSGGYNFPLCNSTAAGAAATACPPNPIALSSPTLRRPAAAPAALLPRTRRRRRRRRRGSHSGCGSPATANGTQVAAAAGPRTTGWTFSQARRGRPPGPGGASGRGHRGSAGAEEEGEEREASARTLQPGSRSSSEPGHDKDG